jgi:DNA repair protein RadC
MNTDSSHVQLTLDGLAITRPPAKPGRPLASLRLRVCEGVEPAGKATFSTSQSVFDYAHELALADREFFIILHLNIKNRLIESEIHSVGAVDSSAIYPREVMRSALLYNSSCLIFVHNHPSGDPDPSISDMEITRALVQAAKFLGLRVLDHIIIARDRFYSFGDSGKIEDYERTSNFK